MGFKNRLAPIKSIKEVDDLPDTQSVVIDVDVIADILLDAVAICGSQNRAAAAIGISSGTVSDFLSGKQKRCTAPVAKRVKAWRDGGCVAPSKPLKRPTTKLIKIDSEKLRPIFSEARKAFSNDTQFISSIGITQKAYEKIMRGEPLRMQKRNADKLDAWVKDCKAGYVLTSSDRVPLAGPQKGDCVGGDGGVFKPITVGCVYEMADVSQSIGHGGRGVPRIIRGRVLAEYPRFYLIELSSGAKTTVLKNDLYLKKPIIKKVPSQNVTAPTQQPLSV